MHNIQYHSILYNNDFRPVICEGWHFIHIVWAHSTILAPPLFIEMSAPRQESQRSWICELRFSIVPLSMIL
jgi:hypothetical protein